VTEAAKDKIIWSEQHSAEDLENEAVGFFSGNSGTLAGGHVVQTLPPTEMSPTKFF